MQVVLNQDVQGTGKKGQLVEVSAGYARNYLFPKNIASPATNSAINEINTRTSAAEHHKALELEDAKNISAALDGKKVVIHSKAGTGDRLFGSVTSKDIAEAIKAQLSCDVDKKKVVLTRDIKNCGEYEILIKVHPGVSCKIKVEVTE